jgi:hypothetical protein
VPYGKGALFVPSMNNPLDEPPVTVWQGNEKVADATTGMRIVLAPGTYFVQLGSGSVEQRFGRTVTVQELKTTVVPVTWSGFTVHVMDAQLNSLRMPYEIIRMGDREYIGVGFGTDERAGEPVSTWILRPGLYRVVRLGNSFLSRTDFATVRLAAGQHTHFLLVMNPDTGDFMGAGEARPEELFKPNANVGASLVLGGDMTPLSQRSSAVGTPGGTGWAFHAFLDSKLNISILDHPLLLRLYLEQAQSKLPGQTSLLKTRDTAEFDLLYIYNYSPWAGPYARGTVVTNAFPGRQTFTPAADYIVHDNVKDVDIENLKQQDAIQLSPSLGTWNMKEGVGFNLRLFKTIFGETTLRTGLGGRQTLIRGRVLQDVSEAGRSYHRYDLLHSATQFGIEGTLIAVGRITRWVVINLLVDTLVPFTGIDNTDLDVESTLAVKLTQFASVNWALRYQVNPLVLNKPIFETDVFLRYSVEFL